MPPHAVSIPTRDFRQPRRWRLAITFAATYPFALAVVLAVQWVMQARSGPLALAAALAPYVLLPVAASLPLLLLRGTVALRLAMLLCLLGSLQFIPRFSTSTASTVSTVSTARPVAGLNNATLTVATWNVAFGYADREVVRRYVEARPADIVALEEEYTSWWDLDYTRWQAREADLARVYPYQIRRHSQGLAILSAYPLLESSSEQAAGGGRDAPQVAWGRFDLGGGRTVVVVVARAHNPTQDGCDLRRLCFDTARRDAEIRQIRALIAPFLARGEPLVLAGDFNLTEREPAYRELVDGLWDAQRIAGGGLGHTWRPFSLARFGVPLLRIDYLLGSPAIRPLDLASDCTPRGADHCLLTATLALP